MELLTMFQKVDRVRRFAIVQFIALAGWIIVQSSFSLSPAGRIIPFSVTIVSEGIWWIALLVTMYVLFIQEYNRFAQSVVELEVANRQLREATNLMLGRARPEQARDEEVPAEPEAVKNEEQPAEPEQIKDEEQPAEPEPVKDEEEVSAEVETVADEEQPAEEHPKEEVPDSQMASSADS